MYASTSKFLSFMEQKDIKYNYEGLNENTKKEIVKVNYSGDNMTTISVQFFFSEDCEDAAIRVFDIASVPKNKVDTIYKTLSDLNNKYRFAKFCFDPRDNTVQMEMDIVFRDANVGEVCVELLSRSVNICDGAYPEIMKAIFA